jgi:hypothetical protein
MNDSEHAYETAKAALKAVEDLLQVVVKLEVRIEILQNRLDTLPKRLAKRKRSHEH